jgi:hypothetical protein
MKTNLISTGELAELLGIRKHRIEYALSEGFLPEPRARFVGKRCFAPDEVRVVASYFGKEQHGDSKEGGAACSISNS